MNVITHETAYDQLTKFEVEKWCEKYVNPAMNNVATIMTIQEFIQYLPMKRNLKK